MLRAPAAETTKTSCGQTRTRTFPALRRHQPPKRPNPRADARPALANAPVSLGEMLHTQRKTRPYPIHTKTAGVCPLFCCRRSRRDDALLMFVPEVCPAVRHTLMQGRIPKAIPAPSRNRLCRDVSRKPALRLAAVTYIWTSPTVSRPLRTYAGTYPKACPALSRTWRGRSPCALGGWRRS